MKNVLILGATGQIGSLVVEQLKNNIEVNKTIYVRNLGKVTE